MIFINEFKRTCNMFILFIIFFSISCEKVTTDLSNITNTWGEAETVKIETEHFTVFLGQDDGAYNHHPQVTSCKGKLYATWSSGIFNEDEPGQRMMMAISETWAKPGAMQDRFLIAEKVNSMIWFLLQKAFMYIRICLLPSAASMIMKSPIQLCRMLLFQKTMPTEM